jgi:exodeoxyribonuclease VII large subunit
VPVQGEGAAAQIAKAIAGFSALPAGGRVPRPDVLIVARGGGSLEDLMAFNDEAVVRAAAACTIPLISAVGHETDTTLIDFASDRRAPTPTAAAELAVPSRTELAAALQQQAARLTGALNRVAQDAKLRLHRAERGLPDLPALLGTARQRLDDRGARLALALPNFLASRHAAVERCAGRLPDPARAVATARQALSDRAHRLGLALPLLVAARRSALTLASATLAGALRHAVAGRAALAARVLPRLTPAPIEARLREARAKLEGCGGRLEAVSHKAVLARGYAAVFSADGQVLARAASVKPGAALRIDFADGSVRATAAREDRRQGALPL